MCRGSLGTGLVFGLMQNMQSEPCPGKRRATTVQRTLRAHASQSALHCGVYPGTMWSPGFTDRTPSPTDSTMAPACGRIQTCSTAVLLVSQSPANTLASHRKLQGVGARFRTCCSLLPEHTACTYLAFATPPIQTAPRAGPFRHSYSPPRSHYLIHVDLMG